MNGEESFEEVISQIEEKVASAGKFFKGAVLNVKYKGRVLSQKEEQIVYELLSKKSGAKIKSIKLEPDDAITGSDNVNKSSIDKMKMKTIYFKGIETGDTKFFRGTVRSGQLINYAGNVVVVGDVNPGAEIIAAGNIVVMGTLRGIVHAGADGNKDSIVVALNFYPTQLRIADVITRSPDEDGNKGQNTPELAFIKDDRIYIERYLFQR
jgi:septum site-determining protein MinC